LQPRRDTWGIRLRSVEQIPETQDVSRRVKATLIFLSEEADAS
jgi:hypothetical protein